MSFRRSLLAASRLNRRQMLTAMALGGAALYWAPDAQSLTRSTSERLATSIFKSLPRLGTVLECQAFHPERGWALQAVDAAFDAVAEVDRDMSVYRPQSDIGRINRSGADGPIAIRASTSAVLQEALELAPRSDGLLDISVAPLLKQWGFPHKRSAGPTLAELDRARDVVDYRAIEHDRVLRTVRLSREGMALDLGSLGKGYAVDCAVAALRRRGVERGLVNAGGDLRLLGAPSHGDAWVVGVQHPLAPERLLLTLELEAASVATSGNYQRYRIYNGQRYGHVIHPHTGLPAHAALSATVVAATAMRADALATVAMLRGARDGVDWLSQWPDVEGFTVAALPHDPQRLRIYATAGLKARITLLAPAATLSG